MIDINPDDIGLGPQTCSGRMKRIVKGYESEYYVALKYKDKWKKLISAKASIRAQGMFDMIILNHGEG